MLILTILAVAVLCAAQYMIFVYAPVEQTMGLVQKIFYYHLPLSWWALVSFTCVFVASALYLWKGEERYDRLAGAAGEIGVLFTALTLATGMIWGRSAWNVWWTWDPRLTTALIMWFVYAAYLALRTAPLGAARRARACAVLGVVAFLDVPLVFYSARLWRSIHPAVIGAKGGGMEPEMWHTVFVCIAAFGLLWLILLLLRLRLMAAASALDARAALLAARDAENASAR
ncbi:cytochrome c assembly protein [Desulfovibrio sp. X2]|uniref:cytochrome c biogenesis protein n=1 Tax=Desulfovibrio sp. X2 TaxID=941449 RepID=UPI000358C065|nr:cytochrome c biogenesis protein CcsA [Desulfovibrio sp. X2]EPR42802.1 cytochrome c assembly protein [Desulfovibrio sp. X2]